MKQKTLPKCSSRLAFTVPILAGLCVAGSLFTSMVSADELDLIFSAKAIHDASYVFNYYNVQSSAGTPLTDSAPDSPYISSQVSEVLNGFHTSVSSRYQIVYDANDNYVVSDSGFSTFSANLIETITIVTSDPALNGTPGTAHFDCSLSGTTHFTDGPGGNNSILVDWPQASTPLAFSTGYSQNQPYPDFLPATRTGSRGINLSTTGSSLSIYTRVGVTVAAGITLDTVTQDRHASVDFDLGLGPVTLTSDATGAGVSYTSSSAAGTGRGQNMPSGSAYNSFNLVNNTGLHSNLTLRDGVASTDQYVRAAFVAPPPLAVVQLASDAVDLAGTGTDPVVIQMSYDPATAHALFGGEAGLRLGCQLAGFFNAISGNTGGGPQFFARAYNPATDFHLGYYGLDTVNHVVWSVVNHNSVYGVTEVPDLLVITSAVSRKTHGAAGDFDINLPLTGARGVECRNSGGNHTLVFTFANDIASGNASVTSGAGSVVGSPSFAANTMTVDLTGVTDVQNIVLTLSNITDNFAQVLPNTSVTMGVLIGDAAGIGNGSVSAADLGFVKSKSGQTVDATNFRADVAVNGSIGAADIGLTKSKSGNVLPP